jgi:Tol biopolymer transport system component
MKRLILFVCMLGIFLPLWAQEIPLTSDNYGHYDPQWSADGNWVVYYKYDATTYPQIYKVSSTGGAEIALTGDDYNHMEQKPSCPVL